MLHITSAIKVLTAGLVDHAIEELNRAGLFDDDSDYGGMLGEAVVDLVEVFAEQGHSGMSAAMVSELFDRLSRYKTLTPITDNPDEWNDVTEMSGYPFWQNKRDSSYFSEDGGKTWWGLEDED
jgi:hypothetical protein